MIWVYEDYKINFWSSYACGFSPFRARIVFRSAIPKKHSHKFKKSYGLLNCGVTLELKIALLMHKQTLHRKLTLPLRISSVTKSVRKLRISLYLLKKSLLEIFIICALKLTYLHPPSSLFSATEYITYRFIRIAIGYYCSIHHVYFKTSCRLQIMFCQNFLKL